MDYAESEAEFILNPNRFNVSITRPKKKYIVIMSQDLLEMLPEDEELHEPALQFKQFKQHFANSVAISLQLPAGPLAGKLYY